MATDPLVLWDLDGTLVRLGIDVAAVARWKEAFAGRFPDWHGGFSPLLPCLEAALAEEAAALSSGEARTRKISVYQDLDAWEEGALGAVEVLTPAADRLLELATAGRPMALISNNGGRAVAHGLKALARHAAVRGLEAPTFTAVVHRTSDLPAKPDPAMLRHALDRLLATSRSAEEPALTFVGDQLGDAEAAARLSAEDSIQVRFINVGPGVDAAASLLALDG